MRRLPVIVVIGLIAGAYTSGGTEVEGDGVDQSGVYAAAIQHTLVDTDLGRRDLIYVAGPSLELWDQWCNIDTGEPGEPPLGENEAACDALAASSFDLPARYEPGSGEAEEIEAALSHAEVEFIEDPQSVIEPFEEGMMIAPVQNDAGLVIFGVPIEADGKIYMPIDTHGSGTLLELTPSGTGWDVTPLGAYIV